jgi:predicted transcriptional regulator
MEQDRMSKSSIGDQELALLRWIADRTNATVAEAAETFGAERGLARSTIITMMERLRRKRHLKRRKVAGVYRYSSSASSAELLRGVVRRFVEQTLDGAVSPVVAYLADAEELSAGELAELEAVVARLQARRAEDEK